MTLCLSCLHMLSSEVMVFKIIFLVLKQYIIIKMYNIHKSEEEIIYRRNIFSLHLRICL